MKKLLVIGAMKIETEELIGSLQGAKNIKIGAFELSVGMVNKTKVYVCCCGIGKVSSGAAASAILTKVKGIQEVVNIGVAGGIGEGLKQGDIVVGSMCVQHDYDQTPDGFKKGQLNGFDSEFLPCDGSMLKRMEGALKLSGKTFHTGVIASGDQFINSSEKAKKLFDDFGAIACDMESAAIAQVCSLFSVRYLAMRAISDNGDDSAVTNFYDFVKKAAKNSTEAILAFIAESN